MINALRDFVYRLLFYLGSVLLGVVNYAAANDAAAVVIVVNGGDADSVAIGEHYAQQRGIPGENIIRLETSGDETISLSEFVETINNPLLEALLEQGWINGVKQPGQDRYGRERLNVAVHRIRYLVTVRGIPLRFSNDPDLVISDDSRIPQQFQVNHASVDSELALLPAPPGLSMTAFVPNPYFEGKPVPDTDANRIIKVSRLDGPTKADVIRLIDRTLEAEESGLIGRAYIDSGGPHSKGDEWLHRAGELAQAAYFDTEFETTRRPRGYPDRLDVPALYFGWYRPNAYGPWREPRWSVPPGAIGYHLHSYSATTVRSASRRWVGPLVAQGYSATFGYVHEPYLEFTIRPDLFMQFLLDGKSFGDAIMMSNPALSWQAVAIGDPLYQPFKTSLDTQLETMMDSPLAAYIGLRQLNRLEAEASEAAALAYAKELFGSHPSLAIAYRLAQIFAQQDKNREALEVLRVIRHIDRFSRDDAALVQAMANLLHRMGDSELGFEVYEKLLSERGLPRGLRIALLEGAVPVAEAAGKAAAASRWSIDLRQLRQPAGGGD